MQNRLLKADLSIRRHPRRLTPHRCALALFTSPSRCPSATTSIEIGLRGRRPGSPTLSKDGLCHRCCSFRIMTAPGLGPRAGPWPGMNLEIGESVRSTKKTLYRIQDPTIGFWFRVYSPSSVADLRGGAKAATDP